MNVMDLMSQLSGGQAVEQLSQNIGAEPNQVQSAVQMALPALIGAMAQNANNPAVTNAITQENGDALNNINGFLGNPQQAMNPGGNILSMILGGGQGAVANQISQQSGLNMGQVASLLTMLAPLVLGYFGRQQTQQNLDQGGIFDMLNGQNQQVQQQSPFGGILGNMLDRNNDGSSMDDLAGLAMQYMTRR